MSIVTAEKTVLYEKVILSIIREHGIISRSEINKATNIRFSTITDITKDLITRGIICEANSLSSAPEGHTYKKALMLNNKYCCVVGVDIQVERITGVLTDFCGNVLSHIALNTSRESTQAELLTTVCQVIDSMLRSAGSKPVLGIGVSTIGILNRKSNTIMLVFEKSNWTDIRLLDALKQHYPQHQVFLEDQVVCKLFAEKWFAQQPFYPNTVFVDIGSVLGASIFFNGIPLRNNVGTIGEIGHFPVSPGNELCTCGNQGCLSTVASANVIVRQVRQALKQGTISILNSMTGNDLSRLTIEMILSAAEQEDRLASHFLSNAALYIGKAISFIVNLLGPEQIILGGSMITDSDFFPNAIIAEVKRSSLYLMVENLRFRKATIVPLGGALGAVCIVLDNFHSYDSTLAPL